MRSPVRRPSSLTLRQPGSRLDKSRSTSRSRACVHAMRTGPTVADASRKRSSARHKLYNVMKGVVRGGRSAPVKRAIDSALRCHRNAFDHEQRIQCARTRINCSTAPEYAAGVHICTMGDQSRLIPADHGASSWESISIQHRLAFGSAPQLTRHLSQPSTELAWTGRLPAEGPGLKPGHRRAKPRGLCHADATLRRERTSRCPRPVLASKTPCATRRIIGGTVVVGLEGRAA